MAKAWWQAEDPSQQDPKAWWDQPSFFGSTATATTPDDHPSFFGGIEHAAGNVVHAAESVGKGAATFLGGMAKGIYDDAATTVKTGKDIVQAVHGVITDPGKLKAMQEATRQNQADLDSGKITLDEYNKKYKQIQDQHEQLSTEVKNRGINEDSGLKSGAAAANTFLNLATLGIGGGGKALAEGGAREIVKASAENGFRSGARKATQVLFSNGASEAKRLALHEAVDQGGATAAKAVTAHLAEQVGGNAALGASQGALTAVDGSNPGATPGDVWHQALMGGLTSGLLVGGGSLLNRDVRAGLHEVPGQVSQGVQTVREGLASRTPLSANEVGGATITNPFGHAPDNAADRPGNSVPDPSSAAPGEQSPQLSRNPSPSEQAQTDLAHEVAAHYSSPDDFLKQSVKAAWNYDKNQTGGAIQRTEDGFSRTSSHSAFYRDYFAQTGHAPSQTAFRDEIEHALETGGDGHGLIHPEESTVYKLLQEHEDSTKSLLSDPSGSYEATRQEHMDALAGQPSPVSVETADPNAPGVPQPANQRGFLQSATEDKTATPELKQGLKAVDPQTYETQHQQPLVDKAQEIINENEAAATQSILGTKGLSSQDVATGYKLMGKASREGRVDEAVRIATHMDEDLRDQGRAIKAADIVGNLSPEGVLRYAARKIRKAGEQASAGRGFEKGLSGAKKVAKDIQGQVENGSPLTKDDVTSAIREVANRESAPSTKIPAGLPAKPGAGQLDINGNPLDPAAAEELSTGQKVAKNIEKAVDPQVKKKADLLVREITKKVKQEMLDPKVKTKKSSIDVLREVFSRNKEAQEAFPEAQRILMEKAKGNPEIQDALQKFFDSELGAPAAGSTLDSAVKEQLVKNETRISDIIHKSWSTQKQSIDDVASALVKEGFDPESAKTVAQEVTDRLTAQTASAKQKVLERLIKEAPKKAKQTYIDKLNKLSNLGALDQSDYLELAKTKLKLPNLSETLGREISGLSQKMQDMPEGADRDAVARQIYEKIATAIPKTKAQRAAELLSAPKSIMSSYDLSGTLRQGGVLGARFRSEAKDAFKKQITYFKSEDAFHKGMSDIRHDPYYDLATRGNIAMTGVDGAEEAFVSQLPEQIPLLGRGIKASDRAYTGALTELRFNSFKHIMNDLKDSGIAPESLSDEQLTSIGKFINTSSGRGYGSKGGLFEKVAPALNRTLFSPRLWKSRLDMLNPAYYAKLDPIARKYALQSAGSFAAIAGTVLGLAGLAGAEVETDPRSSDFLKIKVGDTRYDILGGFQQNLVFAWREISGEKKSSTSGQVTNLKSGDFGAASRLSIISDLIQNKENPVISTGSDMLKGTDKTGQPVNPYSELAKLFVPLNVQDTYAASKSGDPLSALFKATIPGTLGIGVNTYSNPQGADPQYQEFSNSLYGTSQ